MITILKSFGNLGRKRTPTLAVLWSFQAIFASSTVRYSESRRDYKKNLAIQINYGNLHP
jgi:hypothetical protein